MKKYRVVVKFDLSNQKVVDCLMQNFDYDKMDNDGYMVFRHQGNKRSSTTTAINGIKQRLNSFAGFRKGYEIVSVEEI